MTLTVTEPTTHPSADSSRLRHDMRTPINHILGYAELLIDDAEDDERAEAFRTILDLGQLVHRMVEATSFDDPGSALPALGGELEGPIGRVVSLCEAVVDEGPVGRDLGRIRSAAVRLLELTGRQAVRDRPCRRS